MGARGPVPKRSSQRRRRNKDSKTTKVKVEPKSPPSPAASSPTAVEPPKANAQWHPQAKRWYESLKDSGQTVFFEPSDWQAAHFLAGEMSRYLRAKKRSAMMFSYIWTGMADLLTTEAARRRVKMEIERGKPEGESEEVVNLDAYRDRAAAG